MVVWEQGLAAWAARYAGTRRVWDPPVNLGQDLNDFEADIVALDTAGNALAAWTSGNQVRVARYDAATGSWGAPAAVAHGAFPFHPDMAMDALGHAILVWEDSGRINLSRYSAAGNTWRAPVELSAGYFPRVAVDTVGNAIVLSTRDYLLGGSLRAMHYSVASGTWGSPIEVGAAHQFAHRPDVAFDAAGNALAMWSASPVLTTEPYFVAQAVRFDAATGEWSSVTTLGSAERLPSGTPSLAVAATGDAVAAWTGRGHLARVSRYDAASDTWSAPTDLSPLGAEAWVQDAGMDVNGRAIVLWTQDARRVYAAWNAGAGAAWNDPVPLSISSLGALWPKVAMLGDGHATAAWTTHEVECPPQCGGMVQGRRWVGKLGAPAVTGVTASPGVLTVDFIAPPTAEGAIAPANYAYSLDGGATWTPRDPASTVAPLAIGGLTDYIPYALSLRALNSAGAWLSTPPLVVKAGSGSHAPTGLVTTAVDGNTLTISWTPPEVGIVPDQYLLEGGVRAGEVLASIPTGGDAPTFTLVVPTGAYYIRVHGVGGGLRSAASNEVRIFVNVPAAPSAPAHLLGLVDDASVALSWVNTFAGGAPTSLWLNVTGTITTTLPLSLGEAFSATGVPPGTYTVSAVAANDSGVSPPSNAVTLTFPDACSGVPEAPANFQAWKVGSTIFVSWSPPLAGPAVTRYTVRADGAYVGRFTTTGRTLWGAAAPGGYSLSVAASNPCGTGMSAPTRVVVIP